MYGSCRDGDDVLGIFTHEPTALERQEVILRLQLYVYSNFRVESFGPKTKIRNHRTREGRKPDAAPLHEEHD